MVEQGNNGFHSDTPTFTFVMRNLLYYIHVTCTHMCTDHARNVSQRLYATKDSGRSLSFVATLNSALVSFTGQCGDWKTFSNKCYKHFPGSDNHKKFLARTRACSSAGGRAVRLTSTEEMEELGRLIRDTWAIG